MCVSKRHINLPLFVAHPDYLLQIIAVVSVIGGARWVGWEGWGWGGGVSGRRGGGGVGVVVVVVVAGFIGASLCPVQCGGLFPIVARLMTAARVCFPKGLFLFVPRA